MSTDDAVDLRRTDGYAAFVAFHDEIVVVSRFLSEEVRPELQRVSEVSDRARVLWGQFLRVDSWCFTLAKLQTPYEFQSAVSGSRALFELAVDLVLLSEDPAGHEVLLNWEESAKLKVAEAAVRYLQSRGEQPSDEHAWKVDFINRHGDRIRALRRRRGWSKGHPPRWTGRALDADAREADRLRHASHLTEYYELSYRQVCWSVHGSSAVGIRGISAEAFPGKAGFAMRDGAWLAQLATECAVRGLGCEVAIPQERFECLKEQRDWIRTQSFVNTKGKTLAEFVAERGG